MQQAGGGASRQCHTSMERDRHVAADRGWPLRGDQATCGTCTLSRSAVSLKLL